MKKIVVIITAICLSIKTNAQTLKTYEGTFQNGFAKYTYFENEKGERIYEGKFEYTEKGKDFSAKDILGQTVKETASIKQIIGQYKNGKAIGERKRKLFVAAASGIMDLSKVNPTNSKLIEEITYNYDEKGDFTGNYLYAYYDINNNNKIIKKITASIKDGHLIGKYEQIDNSYSPAHSLTGNFTQDGFFDGEWNYVNTNPDLSTIEKLKLNTNATLKENRKYKNGVLLSMKLFDNATGNLLYEYSSKQTPTKDNSSSNISCDSLKLYFIKSMAQQRNTNNKDYQLGDAKNLEYIDYSNIQSKELLPAGLGFATEFASIGGFVKVYSYRYNLNTEERKLYNKGKHCFKLINNADEIKAISSIKTQDNEAQKSLYLEEKILDSVYYYMTKHFLNLFDDSQKKRNVNTSGNRICYVFNDTTNLVRKLLEVIPEQLETAKKINMYYSDTYGPAYAKIGKGNNIENTIVKPAKQLTTAQIYRQDKFNREYGNEVDKLIRSINFTLSEIRKPLLTKIKQANDNDFINEIESLNQKLNNMIIDVDTKCSNLKLWYKITEELSKWTPDSDKIKNFNSEYGTFFNSIPAILYTDKDANSKLKEIEAKFIPENPLLKKK